MLSTNYKVVYFDIIAILFFLFTLLKLELKSLCIYSVCVCVSESEQIGACIQK